FIVVSKQDSDAHGIAAKRKFVTRERLIALMVALAIGCGIFVYGLRWLEFSITFHPVRFGPGERPSPPHGAEEVWFNAADGTHLHGWFFRSESIPETATVVYFHGNGGNISNVSWVGQRLARQ